MQGVDRAGGSFILRGKCNTNLLICKAIGPDGHELKGFRGRRLKAVKNRLSRYECIGMDVCLDQRGATFACRVLVHPNLCPGEPPRYVLTNLKRPDFSPEHTSDGYRLRWQIERLFKEWKSHIELHAFDTANLAEGLIRVSLCVAIVKRYCTHITQRIARVAMSTRTGTKCIHHVLHNILHDLIHRPDCASYSIEAAIEWLSKNARRAHPKRAKITGRLKLGRVHVYAGG